MCRLGPRQFFYYSRKQLAPAFDGIKIDARHRNSHSKSFLGAGDTGYFVLPRCILWKFDYSN